MSFAAAAGLWIGVLALPVIGLYILKIKRQQQVVPYLKMWAQLVAEQRFNSLFRRLQRLLSLLLQLLILLSLVGAFAVWTRSSSHLQEDSVVLLLDTSASMNGLAVAGGDKSRFVVARDKARQLIEGRSSEDEYAVVLSGGQPEVAQGFTRSTLRLREALDAALPTKEPGDLRQAYALAQQVLRGKAHPRIIVLSDRAANAAVELQGQDSSLRWIPIGDSVQNLAITRFQARKNHAVGTDYLLIVVRNFDDKPNKVDLTISIDEQLIKVLPIELEANGEFQQTLEMTLPDGGFAVARIEHAKAEGRQVRDGLEIDDVAFAALPTTRLYRVAFVPSAEHEVVPFRGAFTALVAMVDGQGSRVLGRDDWAKKSEQIATDYDLVVFVNWAPSELPGHGNFLAVHALPGGLPATERPAEQMVRVKDQDREHPLNRFLETKDLVLASTKPLDLSGGHTLLSTTGGPIAAVFASKHRRVVYYGIDMLADLFFLQMAFPIVLRNILGWLHETESDLLEATYSPGAVIQPRFAVLAHQVEVGWRHAGADVSGKMNVAVRQGRFAFADTREPGRYWVRTGEADYRTAVNLFDSTESDLTMPKELPPADPELNSGGFLWGKDLWPLLLLAALGLWVVEWVCFHRRITE